MKEIWADPEFKKKVRAKHEEQVKSGKDAERRKKISATSIEHWQDPDYRATVTAKIAETQSAPEYREAQSKRATEALARPEVKEKLSKSLRESWSGERGNERKKLTSERMTEAWSDPESTRREEQSERMKELWADPEYKKQVSQAISDQIMNDPEEYERRKQQLTKMNQSPERREAVSKQFWECYNNDPAFKDHLRNAVGRVVTIETREKISAAQRGKKHDRPYTTVSACPLSFFRGADREWLAYYKHFLATRPVREYVKGAGLERHHIVPKCMFKRVWHRWDRNNLIWLTPREHFIAHLILSKMYPAFPPLLEAFQFMVLKGEQQIPSRAYGRMKTALTEERSRRVKGFWDDPSYRNHMVEIHRKPALK
jgi:hypothetical protein